MHIDPKMVTLVIDGLFQETVYMYHHINDQRPHLSTYMYVGGMMK